MALNPATPATIVENILHLADMVLVMTVNPGFGGQAYIPEMTTKVTRIRQRANDLGLTDLRIQVDGGIGPNTIEEVAQAGSDTFVAGSAIFKSPDYAATIAQMKTKATV